MQTIVTFANYHTIIIVTLKKNSLIRENKAQNSLSIGHLSKNGRYYTYHTHIHMYTHINTHIYIYTVCAHAHRCEKYL